MTKKDKKQMREDISEAIKKVSDWTEKLEHEDWTTHEQITDLRYALDYLYGAADKLGIDITNL